ncbi:GTP-binding protein EngB required for normal cell division [Nocardiopsis mwathae]|uniref:GTP-binding protein EngB required for normal cell division n=1 Tax=Nocardiopsis mwathae TaxID=1472723 RepID=A0A7W9YEV1_9ACTN|nr:GTPase [Nocardiopsis mwathae]MBB6170812.1 GTP-binding protein EngB required for normal cell division [Nocardiopsis mwathae]
MTTQRNPAHADEEPDVAGAQADPGASPPADPARHAPEAPDGAHRVRGDDQWTGYSLPAKVRRDAGWTQPAGNAWPPSHPEASDPASYPALRRAVDMQSGPHPSLADEQDAPPPPGHPGDGNRARPAGAEQWGDAAAGAVGGPVGPAPDAASASGTYPALRRAVDRVGGGRRRRTNPDLLADDPDDGAGWRTDAGAPPVGGRRSATGPRTAMTPPPATAEAPPGDPGTVPPAAAANTAPPPADSAAQAAPEPQGTDGPATGGADPADPAASDGGARPERPTRGGRHAAPKRPASAVAADTAVGPPEDTVDPDAPGTGPVHDGTDPDDPERLADWVGALTEADDETSKIAGRRTGPIPIVTDETRGDSSAWAATATDEDDEYRISSNDPWQPMPATTREELIARLDALAEIVAIGRDDFDPELIAHARHLLDHAGARLRLSGDHTVVALAGGTGSGKSSLFNALCGLEFSRVGITRPTTSSAHACVWGNEGADGLLDWLGVPHRSRHSRTSVLDTGNSELSGLILLDLPDHDSVRAMHTAEADRLIGAADLLIWVLDPQKYADAAVHHRYLKEMSGYGAVTVAVLNQVDRVEPEELEELLTDLRRLLETESGVHPRVLTTSVLTGHGVRDLRELLIGTVTERRALIDRLVADLDQVIVGFERYRGAAEPPAVSDASRLRLVTDLLSASGVSAIADTTETAHERRGSRRVGWPVTRWARKLRRDPLRAIRMGFHSDDDERGVTGPVDAHQAEIETATAQIADGAGGSLPSPWPKRLRAAARRNLRDLPVGLGNAISETVPDAEDTPLWWQIVRVLQYALLATAGAGLAWFCTLLVSWVGGGLTGIGLLDDPAYLGFAGAVVVATLAVGWLTDVGCRNLVSVAATQRRDQVERESAERVRAIAEELVITPLEEELARYRAFRRALGTALVKHDEQDGSH